MNEDELREILHELTDQALPERSTDPLILDSLLLIELIERLEREVSMTVRSTELTEENFGSIAAILKFIEGKA